MPFDFFKKIFSDFLTVLNCRKMSGNLVAGDLRDFSRMDKRHTSPPRGLGIAWFPMIKDDSFSQNN